MFVSPGLFFDSDFDLIVRVVVCLYERWKEVKRMKKREMVRKRKRMMMMQRKATKLDLCLMKLEVEVLRVLRVRRGIGC